MGDKLLGIRVRKGAGWRRHTQVGREQAVKSGGGSTGFLAIGGSVEVEVSVGTEENTGLSVGPLWEMACGAGSGERG